MRGDLVIIHAVGCVTGFLSTNPYNPYSIPFLWGGLLVVDNFSVTLEESMLTILMMKYFYQDKVL
jgi:hypothetical protein